GHQTDPAVLLDHVSGRVGAKGEQVLNARAREIELFAGGAPWVKRTLVLLVILGLVATMAIFGVSRIGYWLIVADPLEPARAVVILSGRVPFRAIEAASIYRQGWAPEVWLTKEASTAEELALDRLGLNVVRGETYSRQVLERLGVPAQAIRVLNDQVWNTVDEMRLVARELRVSNA